MQALYEREYTPPSPSSKASTQDPTDDYLSHPQDFSDEENEGYDSQPASHGYYRKSTYDSRIEQILYENPEMPILITDAGKNHEGGGSFIVYTIRTGVCYDASRRAFTDLTHICRIWKSGDGTLSSPLCDRLSSTSIPHSSFRPSRRNIQWRIMPLSLPRLRRIPQ